MYFYMQACKENALSATRYKYLLQSTDPNMDSVVQYVKNQQDANSLERRHITMLIHHVNLTMNDTTVMLLHRLAKKVRYESSGSSIENKIV